MVQELASLYVVTGDEPLLVIETLDKLRADCQKAGFLEREVLVLEARSDWSALQQSTQSRSLFGDKKYIEVKIPTGKPGKTGSDAIVRFVNQLAQQANPDAVIAFHLPKLDGTQQKSAWYTALKKIAKVLELPSITRDKLPQWLNQRLALQQQKLAPDALEWVADRVEGNLLAAHQEVLKLGLLHPQGTLTLEQVQEAILHVARYDVFQLRDAILAADYARSIRMIEGLKAEGEALPLILWSVGEDIRALTQIAEVAATGQPITPLFRQFRFWGPREKLAQSALQRISLIQWRNALLHVHDIDRLVKGLTLSNRLPNPWHELMQLCSILCNKPR